MQSARFKGSLLKTAATTEYLTQGFLLKEPSYYFYKRLFTVPLNRFNSKSYDGIIIINDILYYISALTEINFLHGLIK